MCNIYIEVGESYYPSDQYFYSPSINYPEYPFSPDTISQNHNNIYDMVRNCLIGLKLDAENFGTTSWNPFKNLILKGNILILKPNWVMHRNANKNVTEYDLDCLVTHPSIVRAICDYCIIALIIITL